MERIGEYEIRRLLGEGGMGQVYEAEEALSGRVVALKVLRPELTSDPESRERFRREMKLLAALDHPNIVRSLASFEHEGRFVLVLEHLDGPTLADVVRDAGALPWPRATRVAHQIADALSCAHSQTPPVIHRDLKPANIAVLDGDQVRVMDFGIARALDAGAHTTQSVGTLQYMSPEQIDAEPLDARSDLYTLGLVLFELLTGAPPFTSRSPRELLNLQCTSRPPALDEALRAALPEGLELLLLGLLAKDPDDRPQSAAQVRDRLSKLLERAEGAAPAPRASARPVVAAAPAPVVAAAPAPEPAAAPEPAEPEPEPAKPARDQPPRRAPRSGAGAWRAAALILLAVVCGLGTWAVITLNDTSRVTPPQPPQIVHVPPTPAPPAPPPLHDVDRADLHTTPDGALMRRIPAGAFLRGSHAGVGDLDEQPQTPLHLAAYYIDLNEITVGAYERCVTAGACPTSVFTPFSNADQQCNYGAPGRQGHPMNCVSATAAESFCAWRSVNDPVLNYRLPTEAEWEKAARGTAALDLPWGHTPATCELSRIGGCMHHPHGTAPVGSFSADRSPYGLRDVVGNVAEWTLGVYDATQQTDMSRRGDLARTLRGGSWMDPTSRRLADRDTAGLPRPDGQDGEHVGFRCVAAP